MLKVKLRHLNVLEGELNAASEDALRIAIPIRADGPKGDRAVLQPAVAKEGQNTEQRWLGRMVSNTLGEIRKRADLYDSMGAMLKVDIDTETVEVEKLMESKKRKLAEVTELKERVETLRKKVLGQVSSNCLQQIKALRPAPSALAQEEEEKKKASAEQQQAAVRESAILTQVPPLQERAKECVKEMGVRFEQFAEHTESFRQTTTAVTSFLQTKPSKVDQAIRQSQRGGVAAMGGGEEEEGGMVEHATRSKKGAAATAAATATAAAAAKVVALPAPSSSMSKLTAHLGQS